LSVTSATSEKQTWQVGIREKRLLRLIEKVFDMREHQLIASIDTEPLTQLESDVSDDE
jgi:hypothetical protein